MQKASRCKELLDQARAFKDAGNQHYQDNDYRGAIRCYHKCLLNARVVQQIPEAVQLTAQLSPMESEEEEKGKETSPRKVFAENRVANTLDIDF